jgi:phage-related protein
MAKFRWRDYRTASGARPIKKFLAALESTDAAAVAAAMSAVRRFGLKAARHLRGDVYEVRADGDRVSYRILFALEGTKRQVVLLSLHAFVKKTQKTRPEEIELAEKRLAEWRARGSEKRRKRGRGG